MSNPFDNPFAGSGSSENSCPCPADMSTSAKAPKHREHWWTFEGDHWGQIVGLIGVGIIIAALYLYNRMWLKHQQMRAKKSEVSKQSEAYAHQLVKHILPSLQVQRHRFRGLKRKTQTLSVSFQDLGLKLPSGSSVLAGVNGKFNAGRMCAIMGPSGAGKTTFMNVLCGKATYGEMTGKVFINGQEGDISECKSVLGFVPQDDVVHEGLTVSEQIDFSAQLRGPPGLPAKKAQQITEDVLSVMQMDHIRNSIVGGVESRGISGGQRKRVNIGLELAADPTILFLDEPTSGLDSTSSLTIIHSLKKLCELGMTTIMVIHQPRYSLFTLFDDVLLLGKGGRTVYLGPSCGAKSYFEGIGFTMPADENPADWLMDVISGEVPNERIPNFQPQMLFDLWVQHSENQPTAEECEQPKGRAWTKQDDSAALARKLEEEWVKIDQDGSGVMDEDELFKLLTLVVGAKPDEEVAEELFREMAEPGEDVVTKQDFLKYLGSLQDSVVEEPHSSSESDDEASSSSDDEHAQFVSRGVPSRPQVGCIGQFRILTHRRLIQWWRNNLQRGIYMGVIVLAAVILAILDTFLCPEHFWSAAPYLNLHLCLVLLASVYCLSVFSANRPVFWRERSHGLSVVAFFFARVLVNLVDILLQCYVFSSVYFLIRRMPYDFWWYFKPFALASFVASGMGYFISSILPPQHCPFVTALVGFVSCGLLGDPLRVEKMEDNMFLEAGMDVMSITRWTVGMSFLQSIDEVAPTRLSFVDSTMLQQFNNTYGTKPRWQETLGYWHTGTVFLVSMGVVFHLLGLLGLIFVNRSKAV